jgi:methylated-DNA-[protein]-cysteine S-methyltransferase
VPVIEPCVLHWGSVSSPFGVWNILASTPGICWVGTPGAGKEEGVSWLKRRIPVDERISTEEIEPLRQAMDEMKRYFAGEPITFACPLDLHGTPFQRDDWNALLQIPYGETRSYQEIARTIGRPQAIRAVGAANGANPVALIVPCHRVIGSDGKLTGYGGGLPVKAGLLALEREGRAALGTMPAHAQAGIAG